MVDAALPGGPDSESASAGGYSSDVMAAVVELQKVELGRLLRENERLNDRVDQLIKLQEREQTLRQQAQNNIERLTAQLGRLNDQLALPSPEQLRAEVRLKESESRFEALKAVLLKLLGFLDQRDGWRAGEA
jgi:septation ring formation regulator EzrA